MHQHTFAQGCVSQKFQSWPKHLTFYQSYRLSNGQPTAGLSQSVVSCLSDGGPKWQQHIPAATRPGYFRLPLSLTAYILVLMFFFTKLGVLLQC